MSEFTRSERGLSNREAIDNIVQGFQERHEDAERAKDHLRRLHEQEKSAIDEAVIRAREPFLVPIDEAKRAVDDTESVALPSYYVEQFMALPVDELEAFAFDHILQSSANMDIDLFVDRLLSGRTEDDHYSREAVRIKDQMNFFSDFYRSIDEVEELPVMILSVDWREEYDVQAQFEGRASGAGCYSKACSILLDGITRRDIALIRPETTQNGFQRELSKPSAITINFPENSLHITSEVDWGFVESKVHSNADGRDLSFVLLGEDDMTFPPKGFGLSKINWNKSREMDISMTHAHAAHRAKLRSPETTFFLYGDQVNQAIHELLADEAVPVSTKQLLTYKNI